MTTTTRKKQLTVGTKKAPVREFKIGELVQIVSVKPADGSKLLWRQKDQVVQLRTPYHGTLNIEFHKLELVHVGACYPFPPKKK